MLLADSMVNDIAGLLIAGASYPRFGEVLHPRDSILVLPTRFTP